MSERPEVAVIDPGMGNLRSVCRAWEKAGASVRLVERPADVGDPRALVFPGQGGMPHCMQALNESGFADLIRGWIKEDRPYFGICLGLQALFEFSEEGMTDSLNILPGKCRRFCLPPCVKIPHMGWNTVGFTKPTDPLVENLGDEPQFYFVHSYHVEVADPKLIFSQTDYGYMFTSAIRRGNCVATQFHPEKSQAKGLQMYANFVHGLPHV